MKIALYWPKGFDPKYVMPLALGYLKSNLEGKGHEIRIFDCALENISSESLELKETLNSFSPDIVGASCWSPTYEEGLNILRVAKKTNQKVITVLGGAHVTSYPNRAMENLFLDFIFRGEAELSFPVFLDELQKEEPDWTQVKGLVYRNKEGNIIKNQMEREPTIDKIRFPDYEAMKLDSYLEQGYRFNTAYKNNAPVWITRGCPYRCGFCSAPLQNGKIIRTHSVEYMVNWVKYLHFEKGITMINIIDDNFTFNKEYAKEFCREMIKLNIKGLKFGTPNAIRAQRTDIELMKLMKEAGWEHLLIAPESGSKRVLELMKKDLDPQIIIQKVKEIKEVGLKVHGTFILGYPGETEEDIKETTALIRECGFHFLFLNNFQPLPGTPIYDQLVAQNEIKDGLLPKNYSGGERVYTPRDLKNFNFPRYVLKEYMMLAITNPSNIPYMVKLISPRMIITKVFSNLKNMLLKSNKREKIRPEIMVSED